MKRQREAQNVVIKAEADANRIKQALSMLTDSANQIKKKISDLDAQSANWKT